MNSENSLSSRARVMLVDDDHDVHEAVAVLLDRAEIEMVSVFSPEEAFSSLDLMPVDAILLDLNFMRGRTHGEEGFTALARILSDDPDATVVVVTGHSGIRIAVAAMRAGAFDFVMKPWRNEELLERIRVAIAHRRRRREIANLRDGDVPRELPRLLGSSPGIERVRDLVRRVGPTAASVLVVGPAGSGRSLVANLIHNGSARAVEDMVTLDARTAADPLDEGVASDLARSAGSTLLLRHVDRLNGTEQARLLTRMPPGARLIATADSADSLTPSLRAVIGTVEIVIPPLGQRGGDALLLARHFARVAERRHGRPVPGFTPDAEAAIAAAYWRDDARGLAQAVERAVVLGDGGPINATDLGLGFTDGSTIDTFAPTPQTLNLEETERALVETALKRHGFNVSHAAENLGLSRAALYRRMTKYGL